MLVLRGRIQAGLTLGRAMQVIRWNRQTLLLIFILSVALLLIIIWHYPHQEPLITAEESTIAGTHAARQHKLSVIVPFRDRFEELMEFVPNLHSFLTNQGIKHKIIVVNQADKLRFNRASLINIGYHLSVGEFDYLAMHDVDLLPLNPALNYGFPEEHVYHLAAPNLHPLYHYPKFVGGILLLTHKDFYSLNGLSNRYWGWGREDDEFYVRIKEAGLSIKRPTEEEVNTGYKTFRHIHDKVKRPRDYKRIGNQKEAGRHRDRLTGVRDVSYNVTEKYDIVILGAPATVYNVQLNCDRNDTPWCEYQ